MSPTTGARRSGRPPLTDAGALLTAARAIGFARLTVGVVTTAVGVRYSTFYRHFPSLDALRTALVNDVLARELVLPDADRTWQDQVTDIAAALAEMLDRNPGMAATVVSLPDVPTGVVSVYDRLTAALLIAGFDAGDATLASAYALEIVTVRALTDRAGADRDPVATTTATIALLVAGLESGQAGSRTAADRQGAGR